MSGNPSGHNRREKRVDIQESLGRFPLRRSSKSLKQAGGIAGTTGNNHTARKGKVNLTNISALGLNLQESKAANSGQNPDKNRTKTPNARTKAKSRTKFQGQECLYLFNLQKEGESKIRTVNNSKRPTNIWKDKNSLPAAGMAA